MAGAGLRPVPSYDMLSEACGTGGTPAPAVGGIANPALHESNWHIFVVL